jgi:hypothetical protein
MPADHGASPRDQPQLPGISKGRTASEGPNRYVKTDDRTPPRELDRIGYLLTSLPLADELMAVAEGRADGCLGTASGVAGRPEDSENLLQLS